MINLSLIFARNTRIQNYTREREKEKGSLDDGLASTPAEGRSVKAVAWLRSAIPSARLPGTDKSVLRSSSQVPWRCGTAARPQDHPMCRASELIICFNIRSAGCDLVGRHGAKRTGCGHKQAGLQVKTGEQSACRSSLALKRVTGL